MPLLPPLKYAPAEDIPPSVTKASSIRTVPYILIAQITITIHVPPTPPVGTRLPNSTLPCHYFSLPPIRSTVVVVVIVVVI